MKLVLDIGGTKTRIGIVSDTYKLLETSNFKTAANYKTGLKNIFDFIMSKDIRISSACVGIAGVLEKGVLYSSPNLRGWIGKPIKEDFENEFKIKVGFENDAALAGLGEAVYGAGKDYKIIAYITIGTGVGGARIVNRNIDERTYGFEPGHMAFLLETGSKKTNFSFESLVSGKYIKRIYGKAPEDITQKEIWREIVKSAAAGISNAIYFWTPNIVILGGGVALTDNFDITMLKKELERMLVATYPKIPEIKKAVLGDFSGIWGGILYLMNNT